MSSGFPSPSNTLPRRPFPTPTISGAFVLTTVSPGKIPSIGPSGISNVRFFLNPTTSARPTTVPFFSIMHTSPTEAVGPVDSMSRPITSETLPQIRMGSAEAMDDKSG